MALHQNNGLKPRLLTIWYLSGMISSLWLVTFGELFFPPGWSFLQAFLFCGLYFPLLTTVVGYRWSIKRQPILQWKPSGDLPSHNRSVLLGFLVFGGWSGAYYSVGLLVSQRPMGSLMTSLDLAIPFWPKAVFVYITVQLFTVWAVVLAAGTIPTKRMLQAFGTVVVGCCLCFLLFPVEMPPSTLGNKELADWTLAAVRANDVNHNCFPSSHCGMALLAALLLFHRHRVLGYLGLFQALVIGMSTLFTKEHYVADVAVGFALAIVAYKVWISTKEER